MFSFNSPLGMCPECNGLGTKLEFDPALFVAPEQVAARWRRAHLGRAAPQENQSGTYQVAQQIVEHFGHDLDTPWRELSPEECRQAILYGGVPVSWSWENKHSTGEFESVFEGTFNGHAPPLPADPVGGHAELV